MEIHNQYIKPEMTPSQHINYMAVALIHLAGNEMPTEADIQKVVRQLRAIVNKHAVNDAN